MTTSASLSADRDSRQVPSVWRVRVTALLRQLLVHLVLGVGGLLMISPLFWLVTSSLKLPATIYIFPPQWIPRPVYWSNYVEVFRVIPVGLYTRNTLTVSVGATLGQVLTSALVAYAFARIRFPGRDIAFGIILSTLMLPYAVTMIPRYVMFARLGWVGTFLPLVVPHWFGGGAFNIFLLRQFLLTIPTEMDEAAIIDGASHFRIFWMIILPLARPALTVVTVFSFLNQWNNFLGPLIYLNDSKLWTLPLAISSLKDYGSGLDTTHYMLALATIMVIPIVIIYFLAQRAFVEGIALTGIKA